MVQIEQQGKVTILSINPSILPSGKIDALNAGEISEVIDRVIGEGQTSIVLDLSSIEYSTSIGLAVILGGVKAARQRSGDLRLASVRPGVRKLLDMAGFSSRMSIYTTTEEAIQSYQAE